MKRIIKAIVWILIVAGVGFGLYRGYLYTTKKKPARRLVGQTQDIPLVRVTEVGTGTLEQRVFVTGTIEPDFSARVMPETSGVLERFRLKDGTLVEEGLKVNSGEIIAVIEHRDLKAALHEARANLKVAESSLEEAEIQLEHARREKDRMVALYREGTATEQQRDKAVTASRTAIARVQLARDRVEQAEAVLERARLRYEEATVEAPISGVITKRYVDQGSYVNPSMPLVEINNIRYVEVKGGVAERYFQLLRPGRTKAELEVDAYPGRKFKGMVDRIQPEIDPVTRTFKVTMRIPNPKGRLKPGMFARIVLVASRKEGILIIPDAALVDSNNENMVFVVNDGTVIKKPVRTGIEERELNEVAEGLRPGELVVIRGHHLLKEGMKVKTRRK